MSFNAKSYFTTTDMFNNKIEFQLANIFFRLTSLNRSKTMSSKHKCRNFKQKWA